MNLTFLHWMRNLIALYRRRSQSLSESRRPMYSLIFRESFIRIIIRHLRQHLSLSFWLLFHSCCSSLILRAWVFWFFILRKHNTRKKLLSWFLNNFQLWLLPSIFVYVDTFTNVSEKITGQLTPSSSESDTMCAAFLEPAASSSDPLPALLPDLDLCPSPPSLSDERAAFFLLQ